ncbi:hypothetical protein EDEG_00416 [Edhazardia aedis USNM 41457]|uniref:Uncharacterized protein n=1 Tax=Edhazardia aedis (strain USNM 41457) TaxID=1003232 RepID=J9D1W9_EDHAE|nr:hypothetical protein EDEG_00416 [Edhazardia aedis USNM 41457]|eukprot:EJW01564.1 hypothetical protein EDEG_00416 [Edhazardia aedis USNM 41457]
MQLCTQSQCLIVILILKIMCSDDVTAKIINHYRVLDIFDGCCVVLLKCLQEERRSCVILQPKNDINTGDYYEVKQFKSIILLVKFNTAQYVTILCAFKATSEKIVNKEIVLSKKQKLDYLMLKEMALKRFIKSINNNFKQAIIMITKIKNFRDTNEKNLINEISTQLTCFVEANCDKKSKDYIRRRINRLNSQCDR